MKKKQPLFIAFSSQKGGIGKSAITILLASYFQYKMNYRVAIIDSDFPQYSVWGMRERDKKLSMKDPYFKKMAYHQLVTNEIKFYPVEKSTPEQSLDTARELIENYEEDFDFIFFDLPGTLNTKGMIQTLASMNIIFSPIIADRMVLESTLEFAIMLKENIIDTRKGNLKAIHLLWNLVDAREKPELYKTYEKVITDLKFNTLSTFLPDTKRFRHELDEHRKTVFRSTLFPADQRLLKGSKIESLATEILTLLNQYTHDKEE